MFKLVWPFKFTLAKSLSFKIKFGKVLKYFQDLLENVSNHFLKHFPKFEVTLGTCLAKRHCLAQLAKRH